MVPTIMFDFMGFIISIKPDSTSLFLHMFIFGEVCMKGD